MTALRRLASLIALLGLGLLSAVPALASPHTVGPGAGSITETVTLKITGWTCASCEKDIRRALLAVPGVKRAEVSYARGGAVVEVEPGQVTTEQLVQAVAGASTLFASYRATVVPNETLGINANEPGWRDWLSNLFR